MANSALDLISLDFDTLKDNFKTFLKAQNTFKDYDFEGSNMNVLLDVMSYNSFLNAFYLNMVGSEMFLDSAQKRDSIISHAKELNYTPQSMKSSEAVLNLVFDTTGLTGALVIPQGTVFTGTNANGTYNFVTSYNATYTSSNNTFYANSVEIFEGSYVQESFVVDYTEDNQRFLLGNPNIDLTSLSINVLENNGASNTLYSKAETLYGLQSNSYIYFLQAAENEKYEFLFGDGYFGNIPQNGAVVLAKYRICNGPKADGISSFTLSQDLSTINGGQVLLDTLTVTSNSSGGAAAETAEIIQFRAPRWFATQQRGVSNDDYKQLILSEFGTYIQDINVFGGQEVEPKQYGAVVVSIKPYGGTTLPNYIKSKIVTYMNDKSQMRLIMQDPDYLYLTVNSTVQYERTLTALYSTDIENLIIQAISAFSETYLEKFDFDFRYSRFVNTIDNTDASIISNDTNVLITKKLLPLYNTAASYAFSFNNAGHTHETPTLTSSPFTYVNSNGSYPLSYFKDDGAGKIIIYSYINGIYTVLNATAGTVDYTTGDTIINSFMTSYYPTNISIYWAPLNKDVIVDKNKILIIDPNDLNITVIDKVY